MYVTMTALTRLLAANSSSKSQAFRVLTFMICSAFVFMNLYAPKKYLEIHLTKNQQKMQDQQDQLRSQFYKSQVQYSGSAVLLPPHVPVSKLLQEAVNSSDVVVVQRHSVQEYTQLHTAHWIEEGICKELRPSHPTNTSTPHVIFNMSCGCDDLYRNAAAGTGNWLSLFYAMRLAARALGNVDIALQCQDAFEERKNLILPWLMGWFPESTYDSAIKPPSIGQACNKFFNNPTGYMIKEMQHDLRRMAIALVGIPYKGHPSESFAKEHWWNNNRKQLYSMQLPDPQPGDVPLFPDVSLDDAVIQFRCGDYVIQDSWHFVFLRFQDYAHHIPTNTTSIGIITQPFHGGQQRDLDAEYGDKCRTIVYGFVDFLQERFTNAKIRIHNNEKETIALTYARMIMANTSVAGISSFSVFGVVAGFGNGYLQYPNSREWSVNQWLIGLIEESPDLIHYAQNLKLFRPVETLHSGVQVELWKKDSTGRLVLDWMRNETI